MIEENTDKAWGPYDLVVVCSFRYCLGRQTYIVSEYVEWLASVWPMLKDVTKKIIRGELEMAFEKDDEARKQPTKNELTLFPLGAMGDREEWEKIRALYTNQHGGV